MKIKIPERLSDIKLSQYQKFLRTTKDSEDDNFIARQMVAIFCDIPDKVVDQIIAKDFESIVNQIGNALNQSPEFKEVITYEGVKYGFIPNLDEITVAEKADLDTYFKDVQTMDKAMGVLYREIDIQTKRGYLIQDYNADGKSLDLTLDVVFGANVFFYNLMRDLLIYTQNSIKAEAEQNPKVKQILSKNGVGITAFLNSLQETFLNLTMLANLNFLKR